VLQEAIEKKQKKLLIQEREKNILMITKIWKEEILPNFEKKKKDKKIQKIWKMGIPPKY
jgi:predicted RNA-binding protein Jag